MASRKNNLTKNKNSLDNPEYLWYHSPVRFSSITSVINFIKDKTKDNPQLRSKALKNFEKFSQKITVGTRSFQRIDKKKTVSLQSWLKKLFISNGYRRYVWRQSKQNF